MIFVDTGAWFALSVPTDPDHRAAVDFMAASRDRLVTSDFIYDELLTLFRHRGEFERARDWVRQIKAGKCELVAVQRSDIDLATEVFFHFHDKGWSFTDCVSRVLMERLRVVRAFSFDQHFRQFGTVAVVP